MSIYLKNIYINNIFYKVILMEKENSDSEQLSSQENLHTNLYLSDENNKLPTDVNRETSKNEIGPRYTEILSDIEKRDFFFETNKKLKVLFWIILAISVAASVPIIIIKLVVEAKIIIIVCLFIIAILVGFIPCGINIFLNAERHQFEFTKKRTIFFFDKYCKTTYDLLEIKQFKLYSGVINPEIMEYKVELILVDGRVINLLDKWGYANEKEEMENAANDLNAFFIRSGRISKVSNTLDKQNQ